MKIWTKLLKANPNRRTRLHSADDTFIGWRGLRDVPRAMLHYVQVHAFGRYPDLPWWNYPAIAGIGDTLQPSWSVVEFGSGASTAWLARRVGHVLSLETDQDWYDRVARRLAQNGLDNVDLRLCSPDTITEVDLPTHIDLAVVDGPQRTRCIELLAQRMAPGSYIFLDDADGYDEADARLRALTRCQTRYCGLPPGAAHATEGCLAQI